jgi:AP2-associated kinase
MSSNLTGKVIKINSSKYRVGKLIAKGTFSNVYEGSSDTHKSSIAVKHMSFNTSQQSAYEAYVKEVAILEEVESHPNIVKLIDKKELADENTIEIVLILEYCIQNLRWVIERRRLKGASGLPETFILKILYDITKGMSYLHKSDPPIIHRDIRVSNILLGSDGNYKVCNFGN